MIQNSIFRIFWTFFRRERIAKWHLVRFGFILKYIGNSTAIALQSTHTPYIKVLRSYVLVVVVVVVVVFIFDLVGLTACSAMRGVPAHTMLQVKVNIQILKPISPRNESQIFQ